MRTLRLAVLTALAVLSAGTPAQAISPPPTQLDFDDVPLSTPLGDIYEAEGLELSVTTNETTPTETCTAQLEDNGSNRVLVASCPTRFPQVRIAFPDETQFWVGVKVSPGTVPAFLSAFQPSGSPGDSESNEQPSPPPDPPRPGPWSPPLQVTSSGAPQIGSVRVEPFRSPVRELELREIAFSTSPQPDVEITSAPPGFVRSLQATFRFRASTPGAFFSCRVDFGNAFDCTSPRTITVSEADHSFDVLVTTDDYLGRSATRPLASWRADITPPETGINSSDRFAPFPANSRFFQPFATDRSPVTFQCSLNGAPFGACPQNDTYTALPPGNHVGRAIATDAAGNVDQTPAESRWFYDFDSDGDGILDGSDNCDTVANPDQRDADFDRIGDACEADRDRDGIDDAADNCPDTPNADQRDSDFDDLGDACEADADRDGIDDGRDNCPLKSNRTQRDEDDDGIGDACDPLGPVTPPQIGRDSTVRVLSGTVFVFLDGEFVPVSGAGNVPVNTDVDARKGQLTVTTATSASSRKTASARLAAGIFRVKQRLKKGKAATDLTLRTPAGLAKACASKATRPAKGRVRALTAVTKGRFRVVGAAAKATAANAAVTVTDTCSGTRVKVNRGKAKIAVRGRKKPLTLKEGKEFLAKARLFGARKK